MAENGRGAAEPVDERAYALLANTGEARKAFLLIRRPDGSPTGYPMYVMFRGGGLEFTTYRKSPKAIAMMAAPRITCVVMADDDGTPAALAVVGTAAMDEPGTGFAANTGGTAPVAVPDGLVKDVAARLASGKRVVFKVATESVRILASAPAAIGGDDAEA
jgi:hypothetical protein